MSAKYFIDTNVLVYSFDDSAPQKQTQAHQIIKTALDTGEGIISWQIVQEFIRVASGKFQRPLNHLQQKAYYNKVLRPLCQVQPANEIYSLAIDLCYQSKLGFYDSLVVAAAIESGCQELLTEDLTHGQSFRQLKIRNPFI